MSMRHISACFAVMVAVALPQAVPLRADDLTAASRKMLRELKLDADILKGVEAELKVPQAWVDGAKTEEPVIIFDTIRPRDWQKIQAVFADRYPFVKLDHQEVHTSTRRYIMPMTALKQGRHIADLIQPLSGLPSQSRTTEWLEDLSVLPNYKYLPDYGRVLNHVTVGTRMGYWCMSYNTKLVKQAELPKTWDDLADSSLFAGKKLMIGNRPNNWILGLWETNGDAWAETFLRKLFQNVQPQVRKEGLNALVKLTGIGEGHGAIPQAMNRVGEVAASGAPVAYHCPEPVTFMVTEGGILKNSPRLNGARIFLNWFISREGQMAQYWADESTPIRADLHRKEFIPYPEAVAGKSVIKPGSDETKVKMQKAWNAHWLQSGGTIENNESE